VSDKNSSVGAGSYGTRVPEGKSSGRKYHCIVATPFRMRLSTAMYGTRATPSDRTYTA
jgi:hypothetical protein